MVNIKLVYSLLNFDIAWQTNLRNGINFPAEAKLIGLRLSFGEMLSKVIRNLNIS